MTITASSIVRRAAELIQDVTSIRWPVTELVRWVNDAQREILVARPDAINRTATATLAAGTRQSLDAMALNPAPIKLIEITRNMAATSTKRAITLVPRALLDANLPTWHGFPGTVNILHFMVDPRDPKVFYVYPPALPTAQVEVNYSALPTDIAEPPEGSMYGDVVGNLSVPDIYAGPVLDFVMHRIYAKDSTSTGANTSSAARSLAYRASFDAALKAEITATIAVQPQSKQG